MALGPDMLDHLYVRPGRTGMGLGSRFVRLAKTRCPDGLDLYTFQVNERARRFYERNGFVVIDHMAPVTPPSVSRGTSSSRSAPGSARPIVASSR